MGFLPFSSKTCQKNIIKKNSLPQLSETPQVNFNCRFLGKSVINNFIQSEARKYFLYLAWKKQSRRRGVNDLDFHKWQMTPRCSEPPGWQGFPQSAEGFLLLVSRAEHSKPPKSLSEIQGVVFVKLFILITSGNIPKIASITKQLNPIFGSNLGVLAALLISSTAHFSEVPSLFSWKCVCWEHLPPGRNGENKAWLSSHFQNVPCYICIFMSFSFLFATIKATFSIKSKSLLAYQQFFCLNADNLCSVKGNIRCFYLLEWLFMERSLEDAIRDRDVKNRRRVSPAGSCLFINLGAGILAASQSLLTVCWAREGFESRERWFHPSGDEPRAEPVLEQWEQQGWGLSAHSAVWVTPNLLLWE